MSLQLRLRPWLSLLEMLLPWLMLLVLGYYIYLEIVAAPYLGLNFGASSAAVNEVYVPHPTLAIGDELLSMGQVDMDTWRQHLRMPLFPHLAAGDILPLRVRHDGQVVQIDWRVPGRTWPELYDRLVNTWLLGLAFWLAGTATLLLVRPRDSHYWLFSAFFLLTALWLVVGNTNRWGHGESRILFRMAVWLSLPVLLHVHWIVPQPLARLPRPLLWGGYAAALLLAVLQWFEAVPPSLYGSVFALVLVLCLLLLLAHYVRQPQSRRALRLLLAAYGLAFVPLIVLSALTAAGLMTKYTAAGLLFLPLLPGVYFYAVFRHRLGGAELRANRLVTVYLFLALLAVVVAPAAGLLDQALAFPDASPLLYLALALAAAAATLYGFPPFARGVERRLLAMPLPPDDLLATYTARISTSLTPSALTALLRDEVLPTLLVRQSALLGVRNDQMVPLYIEGLALDAHTLTSLLSLLRQGPIYRAAVGDSAVPDGVRVGLPLHFDGQLIGVWLLGRRDPDDHYGPGEIRVLQSLAAQTAIALTNIEQAERLQALYKANVIRHESERRQLAYQLHDEILTHAALLYNNLATAALTPAVQEAYDTLKAQVRQMIAGLRPPMLDYGLAAALDALVDELAGRSDRARVDVAVAAGHLRHAPEVEEQIFRIVQQACENALAHAQAQTVRIGGEISEAGIVVQVEDDGIGFDAGLLSSLPALLAHKHYGLVSMVERAESIGAALSIDTAPGQGTVVEVTWRADAGLDAS